MTQRMRRIESDPAQCAGKQAAMVTSTSVAILSLTRITGKSLDGIQSFMMILMEKRGGNSD